MDKSRLIDIIYNKLMDIYKLDRFDSSYADEAWLVKDKIFIKTKDKTFSLKIEEVKE